MASLALGAWRGPGGLAGLTGGIPVSYEIDQEVEEGVEGQVRQKIRETLELGVRRMNPKEINVVEGVETEEVPSEFLPAGELDLS